MTNSYETGEPFGFRGSKSSGNVLFECEECHHRAFQSRRDRTSAFGMRCPACGCRHLKPSIDGEQRLLDAQGERLSFKDRQDERMGK